MLNATTIIGFIVLGLGIGAAALAAGVLYGRISMIEKMVVEGKRREARTERQLVLWQAKLIERAGFGPLVRRDTGPIEPVGPSRKIESPAQAIERAKREAEHGKPSTPRIPRVPQVPQSIGRDFLKQAASARPPAT